ncbi:MAG: hypothetical protein M9904_14050 [Chitinophagaceae bacterium]|nr:hypothetical protein [Chitinophagaceae bacterium]
MREIMVATQYYLLFISHPIAGLQQRLHTGITIHQQPDGKATKNHVQ